MLCTSAFAASQQDYDDCSQTADAGRSVGACTRIIIDQSESATDRAAAYVQRGNDYVASERLDEAIADYGAAIALDPRNLVAFASRAIAYSRKGDRDRAIADYREASTIDPNSVVAMAAANKEIAAIAALAPAAAPARPDRPADNNPVTRSEGAGRERPRSPGTREGSSHRNRHARHAHSGASGRTHRGRCVTGSFAGYSGHVCF